MTQLPSRALSLSLKCGGLGSTAQDNERTEQERLNKKQCLKHGFETPRPIRKEGKMIQQYTK